MHATAPVHDPAGVSAETRTPPTAIATSSSADTHQLGETIASLAAGIHVATYRLLMLLREFDERLGWNNGFLSCAHWVHSTPTRTVRASGAPDWRTGIDLGASREKVRVARALAALPRISWSMEHGQLSYAKVRALTRVATAQNEAALLDVALCATAAHVERFVRGWRRVDRASEAQEDERRHLTRELRAWVDDDGMVVLRGRLTPEAGAVVLRALEAAADRLFQEAQSSPTGGSLSEEVTPGQRRADALTMLAEAALSADLGRGTAGDRYQVVLHVDEAIVSASGAASPDAGGVLEVDLGAERVSAEASRRMSCDAAVVTMRPDDTGHDQSSSRRTRTIPAAIRRALAARDRTCRFPGCTSRRGDAHHIEHSTPSAHTTRAGGPGWADGGATRLDNLVLLCRRHHRAVHEGDFDLTTGEDGTFEFWRPDGARLRETPSACEPVDISPMDPPAPWDGTPFDLAYAVGVLWRPSASRAPHGPRR